MAQDRDWLQYLPGIRDVYVNGVLQPKCKTLEIIGASGAYNSELNRVVITFVGGGQGATGALGAAGATGATGPQGATGPVGATGVGITGATGPVGVTGVVGVTGATGPNGATGVIGVSGATGANGTVGATGATGPQGATGVVGVTGATGPQGATGAQGPTGATGAQGATGLMQGFLYNFDSNTATNSDPGPNKFRLNNATFASVSEICLDDVDANGANVRTFLDTMDDSTSAIKFFVRVYKVSDPTQFIVLQSSSTGSGSGRWRVTSLTVVQSNGSFTNLDPCMLVFSRVGDIGVTGATGPQGATGAQGPTGATGPQGATGATGP